MESSLCPGRTICRIMTPFSKMEEKVESLEAGFDWAGEKEAVSV